MDWRRFQVESQRLQGLIPSLPALDPAHRKLVAEIALVRLFLLVENTLASAAAKILCGAHYLDATVPSRLVAPATIASAFSLMRSHGRAKPKRYLSWTKSPSIRDNVSLTLSASDPFFATVSAHGSLLTEMRYVRNHIAHANSGTRADFHKVVRQHCGGLRRGLTPGLLLLMSTLGPPSLLQSYIVASRVAIKDLLRA